MTVPSDKKVIASPAGAARNLLRGRLDLPDAVFGQSRSVIAVSAPAGYGKSTLLAQWRQQFDKRRFRIMELTCLSDDREGHRLLLDLAAAVGGAQGLSPQSVLDNFGDQGRLALLRALIADLTGEKTPTALLIDDVHAVSDGPAEALLRQLLASQPEGLIIVLSSRAGLGGLISGPRLECRLQSYDQEGLALTADETQALLEQHLEVASTSLVSRVQAQTRGWPAAVRLVALTLQADEGVQDNFLNSLQRSRAGLADYLNQELLASQPERIKRFLLSLALPREFTTGLAAAIWAEDDTTELIEALEHKAIPMLHRDAGMRYYRLHPLLRDFLLQRLLDQNPARIAELIGRAHGWLLPRDAIEQAIEVSLDGNDLAGAAALISEHAETMVLTQGRHGLFLSWINKLPRAQLARFHEIRLRLAWSLIFLRRYEEAESIRRELSAEQAGVDFYERTLELHRCAEAGLRDRAQETAARTQDWMESWPDADASDRSIAHTLLAFAAKSLGDLPGGLRHAREAQSLARQGGVQYVLAWASMLCVATLAKQGHYREALLEIGRSVDELTPVLGESVPALRMLQAMRAALLYEFDDLADASEALGDGLTAIIEQSSADPIIMGCVTLARIQCAQGDFSGGIETLAEVEVLGRARGLPRVAITLGAERTVLLLRSGELDAARRHWDDLERAIGLADDVRFAKALEDKAGRIRARMALLEGSPAQAIDWLKPGLEHSARTGQWRKHSEILLLMALAEAECGRQAEAAARLNEALTFGLNEGYMRCFVDEGDALADLLDMTPDTSRQGMGEPMRRFREQLLAGMRGANAADAQAEETMSEPLTDRETQILLRLREGPSNRQLADSLFITEGTLKWHLSNIYSKLDVPNRLAAIARAAELGLDRKS